MDLRTADILVYRLYDGDATSQHTFALARGLMQAGVRVQIHSNYPVGAVPPEIAPLAGQRHYADYRAGVDLTILQYPLWFPLAERFREGGGAKIFWYHGVTPPEFWPDPGERDLLSVSQTRTDLAWHAHLAVAASPFTADELHQHSGYPQGRTRVVPLGIDVARFAAPVAPAEVERVRSQWGLHGKRVILHVGRVAGNKRIDLLIDALAALAPRRPDLHLVIVGDHRDGVVTVELTRQLQAQAAALGVADRVTFTGRVDTTLPYYALADVYAQPSQHEGFGVPLVEAMAAGVPVLAAANAALPWLLGGQDDPARAAGLLVAPGDADELACGIAAILDDPERVAMLLARGHARAQAFSLAAFAQAAQAVIDEALSLAAQPPPAATRAPSPLYAAADTLMRGHKVVSSVPLAGPLIAQARIHSTTHLKEAYFDRVMEQQVNFNQLLAREIEDLQRRIAQFQQGRSRHAPRGPHPKRP